MHGTCNWVSVTYIVAVLRLPELDVLRSESLDVTRLINNAGTSRACANVNTNVMVLEDGR